MKKIENSFAVTGFIGKDAEIRTFENASVARYAIAIRRTDKSEETASAFLFVETWRKNENLEDFDTLKKGKMITLEGFFKPEEWTDSETGSKRNRIVLVATKVYAALDVADNTQSEVESKKSE